MELVVVVVMFFPLLFEKCNHFWRSLTICLRLNLQADCVFCLFKPGDLKGFFFPEKGRVVHFVGSSSARSGESLLLAKTWECY